MCVLSSFGVLPSWYLGKNPRCFHAETNNFDQQTASTCLLVEKHNHLGQKIVLNKSYMKSYDTKTQSIKINVNVGTPTVPTLRLCHIYPTLYFYSVV